MDDKSCWGDSMKAEILDLLYLARKHPVEVNRMLMHLGQAFAPNYSRASQKE